MDAELKLRIVLNQPTPGVDFGVQKGHGNDYETIQLQRSKTKDLSFEFSVRVAKGKSEEPNFLGPIVQGPTGQRFVYIDIGTYAGQTGTPWGRRLKVPLSGITWQMIDEMSTDENSCLETDIPGTGRDGGPTCGTVKPFAGWSQNRLR